MNNRLRKLLGRAGLGARIHISILTRRLTSCSRPTFVRAFFALPLCSVAVKRGSTERSVSRFRGALSILVAAISGCAATPTTYYEGTVVDCKGVPVSGIEVFAFRNDSVICHLPTPASCVFPVEVGSSLTDEQGKFQISTSDTAHSLVPARWGEIIVDKHRKLSNRSCLDRNRTIRYPGSPA